MPRMEPFTCSKLSISYHSLPTFITILLYFTISFLATRVEPHMNTNTQFIKSSCGITMYPHLCFKTLSAYASTIQTSPIELADTALNVTLKGAQTTSNMVLKLSKGSNLSPGEVSAVMDCVEEMEDSVDELQQSLVEMVDLEGPDFDVKMGNILTWVSAALTDEDTCMDGFAGNGMDGKIKSTIRRHIVNLARLTSNALALELAQQKGITTIEAAAIRDCIENIGDSIDEIKQSLEAMGNLETAADKKFQMANVKTWMSAAITDEDTCTDGFADGRKVSANVKNKIRKSILNLAKLTSNALSLINHLT
ncbi:hypothetical protein F0562_026498 [Nyssa sinensis]|uniref:Pectinesterase inhibitor domain-containing protein n=1 Tax=Nyssa sinensis TaxID=561372 RepID=A0A5J5BBJ8_9ASTE|nr:hypothetical protein F0562_026498 [Nyssa sinensis]